MKISIVGIGRVGSTLAFATVIKGLCDELILVNRNSSKAYGDAIDLQHAASFLSRSVKIAAGDIADTAGSDVVVVCASVPWRPGMQLRMDLLHGNVALFEELIPELAALNPGANFLILSNPVDVLTYLSLRIAELSPQKVMGISTLIDSARFRAMLSAELAIHPDDLRAYILGEHGPHQFPAMSVAQAGGERIEDTPARRATFQNAVDAGSNVLRYKGYTNFAIAMAAAHVLECMAFDTHRTVPLSVLVDGYCGVHDLCLSVPVVVGRQGVLRVLHPDLNESEHKDFRRAADAVKSGVMEALALIS